MTVVRLFFFLVMLGFPFFAFAQTQPEAVADIAEDFIPITEDFDGAHMTVFGALLSTRSDIIVVIEGPAAKALVREKVRQMGLWVNDEPQLLEPVPSFYAVLSSKPLKKILDSEEIDKLGLGIDALHLDGPAGLGLKENRRARGLYLEIENAVKIRDKKLFRADITLPPNVPVGPYKAKIIEVNSKKVRAVRDATFTVAQVGIGQTIKSLAMQSPVLYAMMSLILVLFVGGAAAYAFRKV